MTTTTPPTTPSAQALVARLERCELDGTLAPDCRRVLQGERFALVTALRSGSGSQIAAARNEAIRVMGMWHISLS